MPWTTSLSLLRCATILVKRSLPALRIGQCQFFHSLSTVSTQKSVFNVACLLLEHMRLLHDWQHLSACFPALPVTRSPASQLPLACRACGMMVAAPRAVDKGEHSTSAPLAAVHLTWHGQNLADSSPATQPGHWNLDL